MTGLAAALWRCWHADRVRVSPAEGRLLRLRPPCYLCIDGQTVALLARRPVTDTGADGAPERIGVSYECAVVTGDGERRGELRVWLSAASVEVGGMDAGTGIGISGTAPRASWRVGAAAPMPLDPAAVEVYQTAPAR